MATCEIFSRIEHHFREIVVVGTKIGVHPFSKITFHQYKNWGQAYHILNKLDKKAFIFYGDFYNSFLYTILEIPFYFTYHDNWPELGSLSLNYFLKSLFYTNCYKRIFKKATRVFTVSEFKTGFISQYCKNVSLVKNGFNYQNSIHENKNRKDVLMVGNIDHRKYSLALKLFALLDQKHQLHIDIYGRLQNKRIAKELNKYPFVTLKDFVKVVPYARYEALLHTSLMENLPMVFCEALYHKLPVLGFSVGGAREIINEKTGILVRPYDIEQMAKALNEIQQTSFDFNRSSNLPLEYSWDKASKIYENYMMK